MTRKKQEPEQQAEKTLTDQVEELLEKYGLPVIQEVFDDDEADSKTKLQALSSLISLRKQTKPEDNSGIVDAAVAARILTGGKFRAGEA